MGVAHAKEAKASKETNEANAVEESTIAKQAKEAKEAATTNYVFRSGTQPTVTASQTPESTTLPSYLAGLEISRFKPWLCEICSRYLLV